uniref:Uncharacterized protein n=1 Tax=Corethron hystrix TaxID=216773 RepID=A0A6U5EFB2_9STRA|mmetsp:Transcript_17262/g.38938  ORF Transcript_17262/g.38938 Transcript_17262/m.38938 type:complete len:195 (+) Transcript_17262:319-903(+)
MHADIMTPRTRIFISAIIVAVFNFSPSAHATLNWYQHLFSTLSPTQKSASSSNIFRHSEISDRCLLASQVKNAETSKYRIHGWRWHRLSAARDLDRLSDLAGSFHFDSSSFDNVGNDPLLVATKFVVDVNLAGLHEVETKVFVPFLRKYICEAKSIGDYQFQKAFGRMLDRWFEKDENGWKSWKDIGTNMVSFT